MSEQTLSRLASRMFHNVSAVESWIEMLEAMALTPIPLKASLTAPLSHTLEPMTVSTAATSAATAASSAGAASTETGMRGPPLLNSLDTLPSGHTSYDEADEDAFGASIDEDSFADEDGWDDD